MTKEKDQSIETLRGIAILLVVAGYITRVDIEPLQLSQPSFVVTFFKYFEAAFSMLRMALFTVISAYLYAAGPVLLENYRKLVKGKFRRIIIPFLVFSTFQYLFFLTVPGYTYRLDHLYRAYLWPYQQLWFLLSVFDIFLLIGLLDSLHLLDNKWKYIAWCLIAGILNVCFEMPGIFSIYGANYLFPYFLLGYGLRRYPELFFSMRTRILCAFVFLISFVIHPVYLAFHPNHPDMPFFYARLLGCIVPFSGIPLIFYFRKTIPFLAFFGYYAFGIHLFHRVSVTLVRLIFQSFEIHNPMAIFSGYLVGGVFLALLMQAFFEQYPLTRVCILGIKKDEKPKAWKEIFSPSVSSKEVLLSNPSTPQPSALQSN